MPKFRFTMFLGICYQFFSALVHLNSYVQVRELLKDRSTLMSEPGGVSVLDGTQEGAYQWVCIY